MHKGFYAGFIIAGNELSLSNLSGMSVYLWQRDDNCMLFLSAVYLILLWLILIKHFMDCRITYG